MSETISVGLGLAEKVFQAQGADFHITPTDTLTASATRSTTAS